MDTAFIRTLSALGDDGRRRSLYGIAAAVALLIAWSTWFFLARISRYEVTDMARLEIDRATSPIQAETTGRVRTSRLVMGREVQAGEVLLELDANPEQLLAQEERTRLDAVVPQVQAIRAQLRAINQSEDRQREANHLAIDEARARFREADAIARLAEDEAARLAKLQAGGLIATRDLAQGRTEEERSRAAAESLHIVVSRLESEQHAKESDRDAARTRLYGEISNLQGARTTGSAKLRKLEYDVERRVIRAPVSGRIGEAQILRVGTYIRDGDVLAVLVPQGALRIVAEFPPSSALGQIRPGQPARLRLHGFPWAAHGSVGASVSAVASEIREGRLRVELSLSKPKTTFVPLQHGLPGSVEVEVERLTPASLVFRAAGQLVSSIVTGSRSERP